MLWGVSSFLYTVLEDGSQLKYPGLAPGLVLFNLVWAYFAPWIHREHQLVFEGTFGLLEGAILWQILRLTRRTREPSARLLLALYVGFAAFAFALWQVDLHLCKSVFLADSSAWWARSNLFTLFGSLHGWWHLFMAYSTHCGILIASIARAEQLGRKPHVAWAARLVPYVEFPSERPKLPHDD
jgi:hypothetical protein